MNVLLSCLLFFDVICVDCGVLVVLFIVGLLVVYIVVSLLFGLFELRVEGYFVC